MQRKLIKILGGILLPHPVGLLLSLAAEGHGDLHNELPRLKTDENRKLNSPSTYEI